jgi:hypothetical protein
VCLGIFSTPGTIFRQCGSVGLALLCEIDRLSLFITIFTPRSLDYRLPSLFWLVCAIFICIGFDVIMKAGLAYYTELAAIFPNRAGADVAYLEQAYKKPKFLFPVSFAVITIILGFAS